MQNRLRTWYAAKAKEVEATGWRPHGLQIGDKVKLVCDGGWRENDMWQYVGERHCYVELEVENGAIGEIVDLLGGYDVVAEFEASVWYQDPDDEHWSMFDREPHEIELPVYERDKESPYDWYFKPVSKKSKPSDKQLPLFED